MEQKLFMVMLGCTPSGRHTEQHDIFFGIGTSLKSLLPDMQAFWPEAEGKIHIDAWREVTTIEGYRIQVVPKKQVGASKERLFFLNLGGYKPNEFEEYHYKVLAVAPNKSTAIKQAKKTAFYQHCGFKGAESHIDDQYGVDVDDVHKVEDILPTSHKANYRLELIKADGVAEDILHVGYVKVSRL
ncbi:MAG: DUF1543 domain-containing protein [Flavobacterium sp.]